MYHRSPAGGASLCYPSLMNETRKIGEILISDVVGYSRLTAADEEHLGAASRGLST